MLNSAHELYRGKQTGFGNAQEFKNASSHDVGVHFLGIWFVLRALWTFDFHFADGTLGILFRPLV